MVSRIKKAGYGRYRSFAPEEDSRLSATDAIRQVAVSSGVFIPFQTPSVAGAIIHNIRCMFIAGLADGMGKPKLILCPHGYDAPLDIRDDAKIWHQPSDIHDFVAEFCPHIVEYEGQIEPSGIDMSTSSTPLTTTSECLKLGQSEARMLLTSCSIPLSGLRLKSMKVLSRQLCCHFERRIPDSAKNLLRLMVSHSCPHIHLWAPRRIRDFLED